MSEQDRSNGGVSLTLDEFQHGRKRKDGSRMDSGTGLSKQEIIKGIESAVKHGYLKVEIHRTDKGKIEKRYSVRMVGDL